MERSITLIGLPGCGKTTVGNLLSHKLKYKFIDMDYYIEEKQGKTIIELFKNDEDYEKFLNTIKNRSIKNFDLTLTINDKIITLSTCANNNKYRIVLHAKKL